MNSRAVLKKKQSIGETNNLHKWAKNERDNRNYGRFFIFHLFAETWYNNVEARNANDSSSANAFVKGKPTKL